ncbi:hypothetical protein BDN71DRAFT_405594 [Pleurotus eryngii]|uniref:Uncharacterized protein n=1 Tax=Pleurotus eryngii TaxID=5323 RepID=A0A9P5ZM77_PLEER|nr:hypothetical protein BDN71DRAFT_405594 [Pleurotus eryngii]
MDSFYDKVSAVQALDQIIVERTATADSPQMFQMDTDTTERFGLTIRREEADVASKLTQLNEETGETEEATIAIQGIVCGVNLPPFETKSSRLDDPKRLAHIRQSVTLTGLGSQSFERTVENCRRAYSMFSRYTPNTKLIPSPEFLGKYETNFGNGVDQYGTITASNRFFTPAKQAAGLSTVAVNDEIDP